jgi:hypothetical protein
MKGWWCREQKGYGTVDSRVVAHPSTNIAHPIRSLASPMPKKNTKLCQRANWHEILLSHHYLGWLCVGQE